MANELVTTFTIQEGNSSQKIGAFENRLKSLNGDLNSLGKNADFGKRISADFDKLHTKASSLNKDFSSIAKTRLDAGNIGGFTKDIVRASERSRQLSSDILDIKRELASPNRKSSIAFLTEELRGAEKEADSLQRKLSTLQGASPNAAGGGGFTKRFGSDSKLSSFQKQNLSYQVNDVLTGLASGQNPTQILAQQGGQIAQIFSPAQATALVAAYGSLVAVVGAGAAAIALTYKITGDLRAEAEKRLKNEIALTVEYGKQQTAARTLIKDLQTVKEDRAFGFAFANQLPGLSDEALRRRQATARQLASLAPVDEKGNASEIYLKNKQIEADIDAEFERRRQTREKSLADSFNQRWESWKKNQADAIEFAKKKQEEFKKSVEEGQKKVEDFGKTMKSVLDVSFSQTDNPIAKTFLEGAKSVDVLQDKLKDLPPQLQAIGQVAIDTQKKINGLNIFEAKLDTALKAGDLRADAQDFRRQSVPTEADFESVFKSFVEKKQGEAKTEYARTEGGGSFRYKTNPFAEYHQITGKNGGFGGFTQTDVRDNPFTAYDSLASGGTIRRDREFNELSDREKRDLIDKFKITDDASLNFNQRLENQLGVINAAGAATVDERRIADKKLIALTQGADPNKLSERVREQAAAAREREAERLGTQETEAKELQQQQIKATKDLTKALEDLKRVAEEKGLDGLKSTIEIIDKSNGTAKVLGASPTPQDTAKTYDLGFSGGTNR